MTQPHHDDAPPPLPSQPLEYRSPSTGNRPPGGSAVGNALAGFGLWVAGLVLAYVSARPIARLAYSVLHATGFGFLLGAGFGQARLGVVVVMLLGTVGLIVWARIRWQRRGMLLGLLLGVLLTCLVPIGIVAVVCGTWH